MKTQSWTLTATGYVNSKTAIVRVLECCLEAVQESGCKLVAHSYNGNDDSAEMKFTLSGEDSEMAVAQAVIDGWSR